MVKKLNTGAAIALARKYGFDLQLIVTLGVETFAQGQTGSHDLMVCPCLYGRPNTYAASITNLNGKTVERFNFTLA